MMTYGVPMSSQGGAKEANLGSESAKISQLARQDDQLWLKSQKKRAHVTQSIANINTQSAKMTNLSAKMANWDAKMAPSWDKK